MTAERRLEAIRAALGDKHPIVPLDGRCAICDVEVYESGDYRGGYYRHGQYSGGAGFDVSECGVTELVRRGNGVVEVYRCARGAGHVDLHQGPQLGHRADHSEAFITWAPHDESTPTPLSKKTGRP